MSVDTDDYTHPQMLLPRSQVPYTLLSQTSMTTDIDVDRSDLNMVPHFIRLRGCLDAGCTLGNISHDQCSKGSTTLAAQPRFAFDEPPQGQGPRWIVYMSEWFYAAVHSQLRQVRLVGVGGRQIICVPNPHPDDPRSQYPGRWSQSSRDSICREGTLTSSGR